MNMTRILDREHFSQIGVCEDKTGPSRLIDVCYQERYNRKPDVCHPQRHTALNNSTTLSDNWFRAYSAPYSRPALKRTSTAMAIAVAIQLVTTHIYSVVAA